MFFFQVYNAFGFLWATAFCSALGQMTLAGAFASYYWAWLKPDDLPWFPLLASLYRCFRYHLGSLALGSFLIATVQLALYSLLKLQRKLRRIENRCTRCLIKVCLCCLGCLENMIKYINRHAYVQMAIMGDNFFTSAKSAFSLLVRNALRVIIVDSTISFFLFFGKLIILALTVAFFYYYYNYHIPLLELTVPPFHYIWVPLVVSPFPSSSRTTAHISRLVTFCRQSVSAVTSSPPCSSAYTQWPSILCSCASSTT
ncbi:hypothetical protein RvY_12453-2 [Ramazzottius varieornatus]|uniref:Choline transporter-like protein n=1 Tax=Ramazzottius varieornatus TaxID=947166 RepID=A0A1D1VJM1_RAMVA|nr:hypothetical protein RvY_12453-2 [Ramazzottius varieornatus]